MALCVAERGEVLGHLRGRRPFDACSEGEDLVGGLHLLLFAPAVHGVGVLGPVELTRSLRCHPAVLHGIGVDATTQLTELHDGEVGRCDERFGSGDGGVAIEDRVVACGDCLNHGFCSCSERRQHVSVDTSEVGFGVVGDAL